MRQQCDENLSLEYMYSIVDTMGFIHSNIHLFFISFSQPYRRVLDQHE